jgi:hypothetical protein
MQPFDLHPEFYNKPIWLTEEEKENPMSVIQGFFEDVKLIEVRQHLSNMLEVCLASSNSLYTDSQERDAVLCFYNQLEKLVDATYVLSKK